MFDETLCMFGSVNLDICSVSLNFEVSMFVYGHPFAKQLAALQRDYLRRATYIEPQFWLRRTRRSRFVDNAARLASPLL